MEANRPNSDTHHSLHVDHPSSLHPHLIMRFLIHVALENTWTWMLLQRTFRGSTTVLLSTAKTTTATIMASLQLQPIDNMPLWASISSNRYCSTVFVIIILPSFLCIQCSVSTQQNTTPPYDKNWPLGYTSSPTSLVLFLEWLYIFHYHPYTYHHYLFCSCVPTSKTHQQLFFSLVPCTFILLYLFFFFSPCELED